MLAGQSLWLELTPRCNLACAFCYNPWRAAPKSDHPASVGYDELLAGIERLLGRVDFSYVALSGGEPLLYPKLAPLVSWLRARDQDTILTTNGRLLTQARASALRDRGLGAVQVSLLGSRSVTHDRLAGRASYHQTLRAMAGSRATGLPTAATFILTGVNAPELPRCVELVSRLGLRHLVVNELQPVGSALLDLGRLMMMAERVEAVLGAARQAAKQWGVELTIIRAATAAARGEALEHGWRRWSISPDGQLKLCNHASRTLGAVVDIPEVRLDAVVTALSKGHYERLGDSVNNCLCFDRALDRRLRALNVVGDHVANAYG
ncbi:MAG: radical SAM protein [Solirubrobacteraceae bacterium]